MQMVRQDLPRSLPTSTIKGLDLGGGGGRVAHGWPPGTHKGPPPWRSGHGAPLGLGSAAGDASGQGSALPDSFSLKAKFLTDAKVKGPP